MTAAVSPAESPVMGPPVELGSHVELRVERGYRAVWIEVAPGLHLVATVPEVFVSSPTVAGALNLPGRMVNATLAALQPPGGGTQNPSRPAASVEALKLANTVATSLLLPPPPPLAPVEQEIEDEEIGWMAPPRQPGCGCQGKKANAGREIGWMVPPAKVGCGCGCQGKNSPGVGYRPRY